MGIAEFGLWKKKHSASGYLAPGMPGVLRATQDDRTRGLTINLIDPSAARIYT